VSIGIVINVAEKEPVEITRYILIVPFCPRHFVRPPLTLLLRPAVSDYFLVRPAGSKRLDSTHLMSDGCNKSKTPGGFFVLFYNRHIGLELNGL